MGSLEHSSFRYCGKQFVQNEKEVSIDVSDNTRKVKPIRVSSERKLSESLGPEDVTRLRSTAGSLAWLARQGRPDLLYRVSALADRSPRIYRIHPYGSKQRGGIGNQGNE